MSGTLVLSYDFELAWGSRTSSQDADYGASHEQTFETVPAMLKILADFEIPSTWATIGALMLRDEWNPTKIPDQTPRYDWFEGDWYDIPSVHSKFRKRFFAPELVERILDCPTPQEISCHTLTHTYAADPATSRQVFDFEIRSCIEIAEQWGIELKTLVFPRNLVGHLDVLRNHGLLAYRSLNTEWYWFGHRFPTSLRRARGMAKVFPLMSNTCRLFDERLTLVPQVYQPSVDRGLVEIKHSAFLPGFHGVSRFVSGDQRVHRIIKGMKLAAQSGKVLSVYFHPHNFNYRRAECLSFFEAICRAAAEMRERGTLKVRTLREIAEEELASA